MSIKVLPPPVKVAPKPRVLAMTPAQYQTARDRYLHGESAEVIALDIGCKRSALDTRFSRDGLPAKRMERLKDGRGERTKDKIAAITEQIADQLSQKTPKGAISLNLHADTLAKVTKTAALVHGWDQNGTVAIIVAGDHTSRAEEPAIEVEEVEELAPNRHQELI